ncbi:MAG: CCA tRNA nucleotidyltransferase [Bacteroidetes bacterium]|nr:CCA tRNA nucleotidyltransferase [Bacteroidota bacterium]
MTTSVESVVKRASKLVTPTASECKHLEKVVEIVSSLLNEAFKDLGEAEKPSVALGGSYAKGTWLKGTHDIDFFLQYPKEYLREKLETTAVENAKRAVQKYRINMRYAEHPYVETFVDGVRVNLVPCYMVEQGAWQSAADRSPYHAKYVRAKFDDSLRHEARLLKRFAKAIGVYGAEVRIKGFSGYVCEVLVLKYGSFEKALENIASIKQREVISVEEYDKAFVMLFNSPLIILDPVDTTRNLGAAISQRNIARLALESRRFLAKPLTSYFTQKRSLKISPKAKNLLERTILVEFSNRKRSPDILWGQLRKSSNALAEKIGFLGFQVLRVGSASDEETNSALLFLLQETSIGSLQLRNGPEYFRKQEVIDFAKKSKGKSILIFIGEDGRLRSIRMREKGSTDALNAIRTLISKNIKSLGISKEIQGEIRRGLIVETGTKAMQRFKRPDHWLIHELLSIANEE